ncbi:hypothetical protein AMTRI_Chr09g17270 [Amborella trichopoda]
MLPMPAMVLDDTVLVGKMIEDMGMGDVRAAVANDKAQGTVAASDPLSPTKPQTCVKKSKNIELGTRSSEKKKKKGELGTRSSARLQA